MERGETTAQVVLAVPVLLLFLLFGIQVSLYFHTAQIASIVAQEAAIAGAAAGAGFEALKKPLQARRGCSGCVG